MLPLLPCQAARPPGRMLPACSLNRLSDVFALKQQDDFISFRKVNFKRTEKTNNVKPKQKKAQLGLTTQQMVT